MENLLSLRSEAPALSQLDCRALAHGLAVEELNQGESLLSFQKLQLQMSQCRVCANEPETHLLVLT